MKGFIVGEYACIPYVNGYIIIHNGQQLEKLCRTESSAKKYITEHSKSLTQGQLPIN